MKHPRERATAPVQAVTANPERVSRAGQPCRRGMDEWSLERASAQPTRS